jgi:hypothetical protein
VRKCLQSNPSELGFWVSNERPLVRTSILDDLYGPLSQFLLAGSRFEGCTTGTCSNEDHAPILLEVPIEECV